METVDQLVRLAWRAVVLRHFEEEMRITPKIQALIAIPYWAATQIFLVYGGTDDGRV